MEGTEEEAASLTVEVGARYQSSSTENVVDDENDDAVVLEVSCSQSRSQSQLLVVLKEEAVVVSRDGVDSRLAVLSSQNQSLVVTRLELEETVLEAVSAATEKQKTLENIFTPEQTLSSWLTRKNAPNYSRN